MDKYLSIITNFGCHWDCPYCIVKKNGITVPKTTLLGLDNLIHSFKENECNIISVSGGGDPLHSYHRHTDYYARLIDLCVDNNIPLEMHTSYIDNQFPTGGCYRVVYHAHDRKQLYRIRRCGSEKVRVVFVATQEMTIEDLLLISKVVDESDDIDELSFRQMVDANYETRYYHHDVLQWGHDKKLWHYIVQDDYNLYYVNGEIYTEFSKIGR